MNKKLYVGNLPFDMQEAALMELFGEGGRTVVNAQIITDRQTGRSRGFGFVEFESADEAQSAMDSINGREFNGRALVVSEARERKPMGGGGGRSFGGGGGGGGGRGDRGGHRY